MRDMEAELAKEIEAYKGWKERFGGFSRDMTLRDYFAAKAMPIVMTPMMEKFCQGRMSEEQIAELKRGSAEAAYELADAMLAARKT